MPTTVSVPWTARTRQAQELVSRLDAYRVGELHTSPYLLCVQTVEPLAAAHDLELRLRPELSEERQGRDGDALLRELADRDAVVCGHGGLDGALQGAPKWRKGTAFVLDRNLRFVEQI
jgi:hypothetical protein